MVTLYHYATLHRLIFCFQSIRHLPVAIHKFQPKIHRNVYSTSTILGLNRLLFDPKECSSNNSDIKSSTSANLATRTTWILKAGDERTDHLLNVLKVTVGKQIRAGVVDVGITDEAVVSSIKPTGDVEISIDSPLTQTPRPRVSMILTIPRPLRLQRLIPVISNLGVHKLILVGAVDVPNDYFGLQLLHKPALMREKLVEGLAQSNVDCAVPEVIVHKYFRNFIENKLEEFFPKERFVRAVAHPWHECDNNLFSNKPMRLSEISKEKKLESQEEIVIAVGGEGGWHEQELKLMDKFGFQPVHLGPRVLRTDTAVCGLLTLGHDVVSSW